MNREVVYSALFALAQNLGVSHNIKTVSRKLKHWNEIPPQMQPALYQVQVKETAIVKRGIPTIWEYKALWFLYVNTNGNEQTPPSIQINSLLDAIETALKPDPTGVQTLGGIVSHAWIEGDIETDEGLLGNQGLAIIPINIRVSNQI